MNPNEETIFQPSTNQEGNENIEVKQEIVTPKSVKKNNGWAKVAIGGVTGILMGAGGMYAGKPYVDEMTDEWRENLADMLEENDLPVPEWLRPSKAEGVIADDDSQKDPEDAGKDDGQEFTAISEPQMVYTEPHTPHASLVQDELHVATVDQNLSFAEAFAQARAEVGPGGVFHWHGGVYNTYTEAEWNSMSAAEHTEFAHQVAPEIHHQVDYNEDTPDVAVVDHKEDTPDIIIVDDQNETAAESDVHILGVNQFVNEDGGVTNAGFATIDGEPIVMIDVDGDGVFDGVFHDNNNNGQMEANEVLDISDAGITTDSWAAQAVAQGNSEDGTFNPGQPESSPQDELASDMPDYANDADVSDVYTA